MLKILLLHSLPYVRLVHQKHYPFAYYSNAMPSNSSDKVQRIYLLV